MDPDADRTYIMYLTCCKLSETSRTLTRIQKRTTDHGAVEYRPYSRLGIIYNSKTGIMKVENMGVK